MKRTRESLISRLGSQEYDLLIIGGGITGVGIALDACSRGLKTALVEMDDFASGTSSRSTKLIHGGLRYLKQFDFKLVNEVGRERAVLHKLAPHLVHPDKMLLPLVKGGTYGSLLTSIGLSVYDWLAGVEAKDRRKMLNREETLRLEPLLRKDILEGGGFYAEYRTDDARLVLSIARTAIGLGADLLNYAKAGELIYEDGKIVGLKAEDLIEGQSFNIRASCTVNATGPWVDDFRTRDQSMNHRHLLLSKGVHLVVARERLPIQHTVYFDHSDGRMIFAVPRGEKVYLGTTDTTYEGDKREPEITEADVTYILSAVNAMFPGTELRPEEVESSWAGLRPLIHEDGKSPSELSRKDEIFDSPSGLISIAGGKLTGYRKMAERVVDRAMAQLKRPIGICLSDSIRLMGGQFESYEEVQEYVDALLQEFPKLLSSRGKAEYLVYNYGSDSRQILQNVNEGGSSKELSLILAELDFSLEHEMVESSLDFFIRRTGRLHFNIQSVLRHREEVLDFLSRRLGWSAERRQQETDLLEQSLRRVSSFRTEQPQA